jgi:ribonuclease BN (tRNA processing enzyme)
MAKLTILGAGTPTPTPSRFGTSYVLQIGDDHLMIDCGPASTHKLVKAGLFPTQIDYLFLTHHHFDHNADLPCFLLCRWDQSTGRENVLQVFGPPPTQAIVDKLIGPHGAFSLDWKARVGAPVSQSVHANRGGSLPRPEPALDVSDVGPGTVLETDGWRVTAAPVHHVEPWLASLAYRVDTADASIVFAGDTGPCETLDKLAAGTDVLVVNCWDHQQTMDDNGEAPGQTGTLDAARMASNAGARKLILTHTGPQLNVPGKKESGIAAIARCYDGEIIFSEELMCVDLGFS